MYKFLLFCHNKRLPYKIDFIIEEPFTYIFTENFSYSPIWSYISGSYQKSPIDTEIFTLSSSHYASAYSVRLLHLHLALFHLHFTMLLLIHKRRRHTRRIRIHLHSTMLLLIPDPFAWAYLSQTRFTFHYASTYTDQEKLFVCAHELFTFHYASTYTNGGKDPASLRRIYIPLCFYLYEKEWTRKCIPLIIYIPLCFYLYLFRL